jgi:hypothetical protein
MSNSLRNLSSAQLKRAASIAEQIEKLQAELSSLLGGGTVAAAPAKAKSAPAKRNMSAAGRARIIAAQKARWAKFHAEQQKAKKAK